MFNKEFILNMIENMEVTAYNDVVLSEGTDRNDLLRGYYLGICDVKKVIEELSVDVESN